MTYDVSSGTLNPTHLLTLLLNEVINLLFFQTSVMLLIAVGKRYNWFKEMLLIINWLPVQGGGVFASVLLFIC